jgi:predicted dehydrogenase
VHEDVASAVLFYPDKDAVFDMTAWEAHGWVEAWRIELFGTDATLMAGLNPAWYRLEVRRSHPQYDRGTHKRGFADAVRTAELSLVVDPSYTGEMSAFLGSVLKSSSDQSELRSAATTLEVLHAIYQSSQDRRPSAVRSVREALDQ